MADTLATFLRDGTLGPLKLGMSLDEVLDVLGAPGDTGQCGQSKILQYGGLEVSFERRRTLALIALYFQRGRQTLPAALAYTGFLPTSSTTRSEFEDYTARHEIPVVIEPTLTFESQVGLKCGRGAMAVFDAAGDQLIDSIQF